MANSPLESLLARLSTRLEERLAGLNFDLPPPPRARGGPPQAPEPRGEARPRPPGLGPASESLARLRRDLGELAGQIEALERLRASDAAAPKPQRRVPPEPKPGPPQPRGAPPEPQAAAPNPAPSEPQTAPGPLIPPAWRAWALALAGLGAGLVLSRWPAALPARRALPASLGPGRQTTALAAVGGGLLGGPREGLCLVTVDERGPRLLELEPFPYPGAWVAQGSGALWSVDPRAGMIRRHDPRSFAALEEFPSPGPAPSAAAFDGESLWTADAVARAVYRHDPRDARAAASAHRVLAARPVGLHREGDRLWVLDGAARRLERYRVGAALEPDGSAELAALLPPGAALGGMSVTAGSVWLVSADPPGLHRVERERLEFK